MESKDEEYLPKKRKIEAKKLIISVASIKIQTVSTATDIRCTRDSRYIHIQHSHFNDHR